MVKLKLYNPCDKLYVEHVKRERALRSESSASAPVHALRGKLHLKDVVPSRTTCYTKYIRDKHNQSSGNDNSRYIAPQKGRLQE